MLMISFLRCSLSYILELKIAKGEYTRIKDSEHIEIRDRGISIDRRSNAFRFDFFFFLFFFRHKEN
jgi:hypothetical protein